MSSVDEIVGELRAVLTGVERAQGLTALADRQAEEIAARATGAGFTAVAAGMVRVRSAVATVRVGVVGLAASVAEAIGAAGGVSRESSPQEVNAALASARRHVTAAGEGGAATIGHLDAARQLVAAALHGGQPGPLLQTLESARQVLVTVVQRARSAGQAADASIAQAGQLGSSGNRSGLAATPRRPALLLPIGR